MLPNFVLRGDTHADIDAIAQATVAVFQSLAISRHTEQHIVEALREAGALAISLVAEVGGRVVGHPGYYRRFGFENARKLAFAGVPPEVFFARAFDGRIPHGHVHFHEAFRAEGPPATVDSGRHG